MPITDALERLGLGTPYRIIVEACAAAVLGSRRVEAPFVVLGRRVWRVPVIGRLWRSIGFRVAEQMARDGGDHRPFAILGIPLHVDVSNWAYTEGYFGGAQFEAATTRFVLDHLQAGQVFADVGANCGYYTLLAARRVGSSGHVYAFEPNPAVYRQLTRHVELNEVADRVEAREIALSDRSADGVPFFVSTVHSGLSSLKSGADRQAPPNTVGTTVTTRTFDQWLSETGLTFVDLVKVDVEGFEANVITGMAGSLARGTVGRIICETTVDSDAWHSLTASGYRPQVLENIGHGGLVNVVFAKP